MAKLKIETNRNTELVKFCTMQDGEIFVYNGGTYVRLENTWWGICITDGSSEEFEDDTLVTYVRRAELKLTI